MIVQKVEQHSHSIGFLGLLTIVLIVLKATGFIDWSWWWVWLPVYIFPLVIGMGLIMVGSFIGVIAIYEHFSFKRRRTLQDKIRGYK